MTNKIVEDRERLQAIVMRRYADLVKDLRLALCEDCRCYHDVSYMPGIMSKACEHNLLPVTTKGEQCPYFDARAR